MRQELLHKISGRAILTLSLIALAAVLAGYTQPRLSDEGSLAHIFQLAVAAVAPAALVFLLTADWRHAWRTIRLLALSSIVFVFAFGALYWLEHVFYVEHYR
jgi:uncharacterized YccA/Bax inhibitor family protein